MKITFEDGTVIENDWPETVTAEDFAVKVKELTALVNYKLELQGTKATKSTVKQKKRRIIRKTKITPEIIDKIKELAAQGYSQTAVGKAFGKSDSWVSSLIASGKVPIGIFPQRKRKFI